MHIAMNVALCDRWLNWRNPRDRLGGKTTERDVVGKQQMLMAV